ncbi:MAG TPA: DUF4160 domain-containing protein [Candidatus Rifleibacterium sp.]|nr:DUF4160 domain-containing protein [Candidatus Rifleibacterium sp.]HPT45656.1 DUF4160 domain-containing protein [Candidatus Rifleibacterium sp.]
MKPDARKYEPFRFNFYSHEPDEPPHVHVDRENCSAKFWLEPVSLATNIGFSAVELRKIEKIVISSKKDFLEAWYEFFGP